MWPDLIRKAKEGGLDVIQTYVFWNGHEPSPGKVRKILFWICHQLDFFMCEQSTGSLDSTFMCVLASSAVLFRGQL